mmetsp:Transcript_110619/g.253319  ORF Transcript_110619/g.253319 Transcript_110619/m.253319 type:complete len:221 (+) Transcript_110619:2424-3086(+)
MSAAAMIRPNVRWGYRQSVGPKVLVLLLDTQVVPNWHSWGDRSDRTAPRQARPRADGARPITVVCNLVPCWHPPQLSGHKPAARWHSSARASCWQFMPKRADTIVSFWSKQSPPQGLALQEGREASKEMQLMSLLVSALAISLYPSVPPVPWPPTTITRPNASTTTPASTRGEKGANTSADSKVSPARVVNCTSPAGSPGCSWPPVSCARAGCPVRSTKA